jgi:hypothetical protein
VQLVAVAALEANKLQNLKVHLTKFMEFPCGEDINFSPIKKLSAFGGIRITIPLFTETRHSAIFLP